MTSRSGSVSDSGTSKTSERARLEIDGFWDIETKSWTQWIAGGIRLRDGYHAFDCRSPTGESDFFSFILETVEGTIWSWNGGKYDDLWFLEWCLKRGVKATITLAGQRIIAIKIGRLILRDAVALIPMSLRKASSIAGLEKTDTGLDCICRPGAPSWVGCGGYCAINPGMTRVQWQRLHDYLQRDCVNGLEILDTVQEFADLHDLDLKATVGSSAWATLQRRLGLPDADWKDGYEGRLYNRVRPSYYGGRPQTFRPVSYRGKHWDVHAAYPAAMRDLALPTGQRRYVRGPDARRADGPGAYSCTVDVPDMHIPPLPVRGKHRMYYPTGRITGVWTDVELSYAQSLGCKIVDVDYAVTWARSENLFRSEMERLIEIRDNAPNPGLRSWMKWYMNSATGKMAQRPERERIVMNPSEVKPCPALAFCLGPPMCHPSRGCCRHECHGTCGRHRMVQGHPAVWSTKAWAMPPCGHIHWAAAMTAHQRTVLHRQLIDDGLGGASAVYCDTDSVFAEHDRTWNMGNGLGQWACEGQYEAFVSLAPKTYSYEDPETGEFVARAKGVPDAARHWDQLRAGVAIDRGVESFRSALRGVRDGGSLFRRKNFSRRVDPEAGFFGDRVLDGEVTRPPTAGEMKEREGIHVDAA